MELFVQWALSLLSGALIFFIFIVLQARPGWSKKSIWLGLVLFFFSTSITFSIIPDIRAKINGFPNQRTENEAKEKGYSEYKPYKEYLDCIDHQQSLKLQSEWQTTKKEKIKESKSQVIVAQSIICSDVKDMYKASILAKAGPYALQLKMPYSCDYLPSDFPIQGYSATMLPGVIQTFTSAGTVYTSSGSIDWKLTNEAKQKLLNEGINPEVPIKKIQYDIASCERGNRNSGTSQSKKSPSLDKKAGKSGSILTPKDSNKNQSKEKAEVVSWHDLGHLEDYKSSDHLKDAYTSYLESCSNLKKEKCKKEYELWDRELNHYYGKIMDELKAPQSSLVRKSQRTWINYRDQTYAAGKALISIKYPADGTIYGQMAAADFSNLKSNVVKHRAILLYRWSKDLDWKESMK